MKHYFLGLAADLGARGIWRHTFAIGTEADRKNLRAWLGKRYDGEAVLTKNGRSGLAMALIQYFQPGDAILVNGFTCYAVYEAIEAAGLRPAWADISPRDLNFTVETLRAAYRRVPGVKGVIIQNSLGNPVEIGKIERFAKRHGLTIIEDLAHSTGVHYLDGREAGTVGSATVLSFGKDKVVDCCSGGAVVFREGVEGLDLAQLEPKMAPKASDVLRARFYPLFGAITRGLSYVHLSGVFMRLMLKIHWVERSADNRLDLTRKIAKFEAKLALERLKRLPRRSRRPLRQFYLVHNRAEALRELQRNGYYFNSFWYERPVSPKRYYGEVDFPEEECPVATEVASEIVNFPNYYNAEQLRPAREIIETYEIKERLNTRGVIEQIKEVAVASAKAEGNKILRKVADKVADALVEGATDKAAEMIVARDERKAAKKARREERADDRVVNVEDLARVDEETNSGDLARDNEETGERK